MSIRVLVFAYPIFIQATLFKVLLEIGKEVNAVVSAGDTNLRAGHPHFRLFEFGHHLLRKFFAHYAERQKTSAGDGGGGLLVCELLFSKSAREAYELEYGYGAFEWSMIHLILRPMDFIDSPDLFVLLIFHL